MDLKINNHMDFNSKFIYKPVKNKRINNYLNKLLSIDLNDKTSKDLVKKMPFNVQVYNTNKSKKTIHPRYLFSVNIPETKTKNGCWGTIKINKKINLMII